MNRNHKRKIDSADSLSVGGPIVASKVTLCLYNDVINIDAVSLCLGVKPTGGHIKGEIIGRRKPAKFGMWYLEAPDNIPFENKVKYLIRKTTNDISVWDSLKSTHIVQLRCAMFLHSWNEGFELPANLVAEIGNRHWEFLFEAYSAEGDDIIDSFLSKESMK